MLIDLLITQCTSAALTLYHEIFTTQSNNKHIPIVIGTERERVIDRIEDFLLHKQENIMKNNCIVHSSPLYDTIVFHLLGSILFQLTFVYLYGKYFSG